MSQPATRFLTMAEIEQLSTFCRHTIAAKVARGEFPVPTKLSDGPKGRLGWPVDSWERWVAERKAVTQAASGPVAAHAG